VKVINLWSFAIFQRVSRPESALKESGIRLVSSTLNDRKSTMSTPVPHEVERASSTRSTSDEDMQQRIQRMIDLQNEEMKLSQHYEDDRDTNQQQQQQYSGYSSRASSTRGEPPESTIPPEFSTSSSSEPLKNKTMSRSVGGLSTLQDLSQAGGEDTASPEIAMIVTGSHCHRMSQV